MTPKPTGSRKKPYRSPRLVTYGDLRRLTNFVVTPVKGGAKADGTGAPKTRT